MCYYYMGRKWYRANLNNHAHLRARFGLLHIGFVKIRRAYLPAMGATAKLPRTNEATPKDYG